MQKEKNKGDESIKKWMALSISLILVFGLTACGADNSRNTAAAQEQAAEKENTGDSHILIAYFSVPEDVDTSGVDAAAGASIVVKNEEVLGNTEYVASIIQQTVGGDLFRIETVEQYPLDHEPLVDQAAEEQDADARPALAAHIEDLDQYDTIILGYPNWWYDMPMVMYSFFEEYDFSGKAIIPFNVHNGSRFSDTIHTIQNLEPDAVVVEDGFTVSERNVAEAQNDVTEWLSSLEY